MPVGITRHAANAVTALRLVLTPFFLWAVAGAAGERSEIAAAVLFAVIAASDYVDGRLARRFDAASAGGRVLDHVADITFLLAGLGMYVALGAAPWWVPVSVAAAFTTYVVDSWRRSGRAGSLIGSRLGHVGGVCNYVLVGVLVGNRTLGLEWLPPAVMHALFAAVPLYSGASILSRVAPRPVRARTSAPRRAN